MEDLPLEDLISVSLTSIRARYMAAIVFELRMAELFEPYAISYYMFRLLQLVTGVGLSGSVIPRLILHRLRDATAFVPGDLDLYIPNSSWDRVLTFFANTTPYVPDSDPSTGYGVGDNIRRVYWMRTPDDHGVLNLMRCYDDNVYGPPVQFHSSVVIGCITYHRAWFPYLSLTSRRISILNPSSFRVEAQGERLRALAILRKYQQRDITFWRDYETHHTCGVDRFCPSTLRTSDDDCCQVLDLCGINARSLAEVDNIENGDYTVTSWTMGGQGCISSCDDKSHERRAKPAFCVSRLCWRDMAGAVHWTTFFKSPVYKDDSYLFHAALTSKRHWNAAVSRLTEECLPPRREYAMLPATGPFTNITALPLELLRRIMKLFDLRGLCSLASTCRFFHIECTSIVNQHMESAFIRVGLSWISFRFMLSQTGAVLSGFFLYHLIQFDDTTDKAVTSMDLYVREGSSRSLLVKYLSVATGYTRDRKICAPSLGIESSEYFRVPGLATELAVHTCNEEPRETVIRAPLTCLFNWMCGKGIFVGYPDLTFDESALVSHQALPLRGASYQIAAALELRDRAQDHRVTIRRYHSGDNLYSSPPCSPPFDCPSAHRNSFDTQSFQMIFNHTGWHRNAGRQEVDVDVFWVLGSMDCDVANTGIRFDVRSEPREDRPYASEDSMYMVRFDMWMY
ncbi:hypothetical protein B0H12DRAFT_1232101 [Mycena haematopus]|nr:hypothetical protein B0H12DRAFT_1232101 [Mycena haematopus]